MQKARILKEATSIVAYLVIGLILFLIVGEIYARLTYKESYLTGFTKGDRVFHHLPLPYYKGTMHSEGDFDVPFMTNNKGMRGPGDYIYKKDFGVFRVAVLGDSFTFGVGVNADETASNILERLLNNSGQGRYEVYNFGVNSYSPILEYIYLKKEVIKYRPDLVILQLDLCDVQDDYLYEGHIVYDARGDIESCDPLRINNHLDLGAFLMSHSRLFYILDVKFFQSIRKMRTLGLANYFTNKSKGIRNKTEILTNKDIDNIYFDRFLFAREGKNRDVVMRHWNRTAKYILMIKKYLDEKGIKFIMVSCPYGHQVGEAQWARGRRYWAFEPGTRYDAKETFSIIEGFAQANGIDFVNLYEALLASNDKPLYFNNDGHWTKAGQKIAAETIFKSPAFERAILK